ncbi:hypothetical protein ABPG74_003122 [Tetrahymena malaccensis]
MASNYQEQEHLYHQNQNHTIRDNLEQQQTPINLPNDLSGEYNSSEVLCANCRKIGKSEIKCEANKWTCLYACMLSPIFICFVPFFINSCQDVYHKCPNCQIQIGFTEHNPC